MSTITENSLIQALKELYAGYLPWYGVEGAKEELISRIKALAKVDQILVGIELEEG